MAGVRSRRTGRWVLIGVGLATLVVGGMIAATVPRGERESSVAVEPFGDAPVQVRIAVEAIDANRGTMKVNVAAVATSADDVPAGGYSVLTDIEGVPPLRLQPDSLTLSEAEAEVRFDRGNVSSYPFDHYDGTISLLAVAGSPNTLSDVVSATVIPMTLTMVDTASGFDLDASVLGGAGTTDVPINQISYSVDRSLPTLVWASVMMGIYWLLTAAVVAVVLVTVLGYREWETRHLAWLAAMIFAFTSFRNAAPGSPPIGVYFDFASFFWAELIVALCLAAMVINYLVGRTTDSLAGIAVVGAEVDAGPEPVDRT